VSKEQHISGGVHISGDATVTFTGSAVAAAEQSTATVNAGPAPAPVDEEALALRVLALAQQLAASRIPGAADEAADLQDAVTAPSRRWAQVRRALARIAQGAAAATVAANEIQGLDAAIKALLP
jgi:hypothetical protein